MRRDAATTMSQQVLTILERHTRRAQSAAESVLEIVDANTPQSRRRRFAVLFSPSIRRASPSRLPSRIVNLGHRLRLAFFIMRVYEYVD